MVLVITRGLKYPALIAWDRTALTQCWLFHVPFGAWTGSFAAMNSNSRLRSRESLPIFTHKELSHVSSVNRLVCGPQLVYILFSTSRPLLSLVKCVSVTTWRSRKQGTLCRVPRYHAIAQCKSLLAKIRLRLLGKYSMATMWMSSFSFFVSSKRSIIRLMPGILPNLRSRARISSGVRDILEDLVDSMCGVWLYRKNSRERMLQIHHPGKAGFYIFSLCAEPPILRRLSVRVWSRNPRTPYTRWYTASCYASYLYCRRLNLVFGDIGGIPARQQSCVMDHSSYWHNMIPILIRLTATLGAHLMDHYRLA